AFGNSQDQNPLGAASDAKSVGGAGDHMSSSMKGQPPVAEQEENAALAALGLLPARELAKIPVELVDEMKEAASLLAEMAPSVSPAPSIKSRLMERVSNFDALKPLADVRRYHDQWVHSGVPGIDLKTL